MDAKYVIEVHKNVYGWDWHVIGLFGAHGANGHAPDEPTARKCAQAVIDALSPQPTAPTDARSLWDALNNLLNAVGDVAADIDERAFMSACDAIDAHWPADVTRLDAVGRPMTATPQPTTPAGFDFEKSGAESWETARLALEADGEDVAELLRAAGKNASDYLTNTTPQPPTPTDAERKAARELLRNLADYPQQRRDGRGLTDADVEAVAQAIADGGT